MALSRVQSVGDRVNFIPVRMLQTRTKPTPRESRLRTLLMGTAL